MSDAATAMTRLELPARETLANEIARRLIEHFLHTEGMGPGSRLPSERALADSLGVGRGIVREALKSLSLLGLIDVRQGDGTYLARPDNTLLPRVIEWGLLLGERRLADLIESWSLLECDIARLAAERRSDDDLEQLRAAVKRIRATQGPESLTDADLAFHHRLARSADNRVLADMLSGVQSLLRVWMVRSLADQPETGAILREDERVLAAVSAGDAQKAEAAMRRLVQGVGKRLEPWVRSAARPTTSVEDRR